LRAEAFAFHFFLEFVALGFLFDKARAVAEFCLPLAAPPRSHPVLALDLTLELPALGFDFHFARAIPELAKE
jgi:hypothetical protein